MRFFLNGFFLLWSMAATGQQLPPETFYPHLTAGSRQQADALSVGWQPAALANISTFSAGMYGVRPFMVPALYHAGISVAAPLGGQVLGFQLYQQGSEVLRQSALALQFARPLGSFARVGVQAQYLQGKAQGYEAAATIGYTAGAQIQLAQGVQALASIANPGREQTGGKKQPAWCQLGIAADVSEALFLGISLRKVGGLQPDIMAALQYRLASNVLLRTGLQSGGQFVLGAGCVLGSLRLDVFTQLHSRLGLSPGLQLVFQPVPEK